MQRLRLSAAVLLTVALISCDEGPHAALFEEPTIVTRLELHDSHNRVLWRIDAVSQQSVRLVPYGTVPIGFKQVTPRVGLPRPLRAGEPLLLVYAMPTGWCRHWGKAVGSDSFLGGGWLAGPWCGTTASEVFAEGLTSIDNLPEPHTHPCP